MIRICCSLALASLVLSCPSLVRAQAGPENKNEPVDLKAVLNELREMKKEIKDQFVSHGLALGKLSEEVFDLAQKNRMLREDFAKAAMRADDMDREIKKLRAELDSLRKNGGSGGDALVLEEIRAKVNQMNDTLAKLTAKRVDALSPPAQSGRVLLANHYVDELTFYINDKRWVVPAQSTILIEDMPAGMFAYKVTHSTFGERLSNPRAVLVPGQTYTLSAK